MAKKNASANSTDYGKLRPSEIVLGVIALLMLIGWVLRGISWYGLDPTPATSFPWFATFSIPSAILVLVLIMLKMNVIEILPGNLQEKMLPYVSLFPVVGFLIAELGSFQSFLTVGGAMALAYISATSYWHNYIPDFVTNPLGAPSQPEGASEKPAAAPAAKSQAEPDKTADPTGAAETSQAEPNKTSTPPKAAETSQAKPSPPTGDGDKSPPDGETPAQSS